MLKSSIRRTHHKTAHQHIYLMTDIIDAHVSLKIAHIDTFVSSHVDDYGYFEPGIRFVFTLTGQTHLCFDDDDKRYQIIRLEGNQGILLPINQKTLGIKQFVAGQQKELVIFCNYYHLENLGISPTLIKVFRESHLKSFEIDMTTIKGQLEDLLYHYQIHKTSPKRLVNDLIRKLFGQICCNIQHSVDVYHQVIQAGRFLQNTSQIPSIKALSNLCLTNRTTLQTQFQKVFGISVIRYGRECRLYMGLYALKCGESVHDAAYLAGYDNPECFSKAFKKFFGRNPSEFKM